MAVSTDRRQGVSSSAAIKVACAASTTANITLSGEQTIDGITVVSGNRALVLNQTDKKENGIYDVSTSTWTRSVDWNGSYDAVEGSLVYVLFGTQAGWWYASVEGGGDNSVDDITIGTTEVNFEQASTSLASVSAFGQTLIDDASAAAARTTLGLGDLATQNDSDNLALSGDNTFSGTTNTFSNAVVVNGTLTCSALTHATGVTIKDTSTFSPRINTERADGHGSGANIFELSVKGYDSASNLTEYADFDFEVLDNTNGSEDCRIYLNAMRNGSSVTAMVLGPNGGGVAIGNTTAGGDGNLGVDGGLTFDGGTNTMDYYEEGTWTPVLSDGTNNATSTVSVGTYTRIGRMVHVKGRLTISSLGSVSGDLRITGLPFAVSSATNSQGTFNCGFASTMAIAANSSITGILPAATSIIGLYLFDAITGTTPLQHSEWTAAGDAIFDATYYV